MSCDCKYRSHHKRISTAETLTARFSQQKPDFSDIPVDERPQVVTECWVEGCCYEHRFIPPDSHIVFRPLRIQLPIPGSEKIIVHTTGFSIEAGVYMKRLIKAFGEL